MTTGFILINTSPQFEHEVYRKLLKDKRINEVTPLFGEYDFIVKIKTEDYSSLGDIVVNHIRSIHGVIDTKTLTGSKL